MGIFDKLMSFSCKLGILDRLFGKHGEAKKLKQRREIINNIAKAINLSKALHGIIKEDTYERITTFIEHKEEFLRTVGEEAVMLIELQIIIQIYLDILISYFTGELSDQEFKKLGLNMWHFIEDLIWVIDDHDMSQEWKSYLETAHMRESIDPVSYTHLTLPTTERV